MDGFQFFSSGPAVGRKLVVVRALRLAWPCRGLEYYCTPVIVAVMVVGAIPSHDLRRSQRKSNGDGSEAQNGKLGPPRVGGVSSNVFS